LFRNCIWFWFETK